MNKNNTRMALNRAYLAISILGKSLKLNIKYTNVKHIELNKKDTEINLILPKFYRNKNNTEIVNLSIQKLYSQIANIEIENAMETARHILRFAPEDYKLERLHGEFYKCTKDKILIINPDIVQYNRDIIITTILQGFCKIKYKTNSTNYKKVLNKAIENYSEAKEKQLYKQLKAS